MQKQRPRSLFLYALVGLLSPLPWFAVGAGIIALAITQRWPEALGPAVGLLCYLGAGCGGSACSGWLCGRMLARRMGVDSVVSLFLANSAGWTGLAFPAIPVVESLHASEAMPFLLVGLCFSILGLLFTWWGMKLGRKGSSDAA